VLKQLARTKVNNLLQASFGGHDADQTDLIEGLDRNWALKESFQMNVYHVCNPLVTR
jgi:hypothetical protein